MLQPYGAARHLSINNIVFIVLHERHYASLFTKYQFSCFLLLRCVVTIDNVKKKKIKVDSEYCVFQKKQIHTYPTGHQEFFYDSR